MKENNIFRKIFKESESKIPIIIGPTASGKTKLSLEMYQFNNSIEIISVDSRQIFKGFCIGTAQPTNIELKKAPHHLINYLHPDFKLTVPKYLHMIQSSIKLIIKNKKSPLLVGGSFLYINSIINGIIDSAHSNTDYRANLENKIKRNGALPLFNKLKSIDPQYASKIHLNDHRRIIRALEILKESDTTPTEHYKKQSHKDKTLKNNYYIIAIQKEKEEIKKKIFERTRMMLDNGWVEEVQQLIKNGVCINSLPMQSLGYREIVMYLNNSLNLDELEKLIASKTWAFAKKQINWMKRFKPNHIY